MQDKGKMQQIFYFDKTMLKKLKAYALETDTPFHKFIDYELIQFEQMLIDKCAEIDKIRMKTYEAMIKAQEEQKIAEEHPLKVVGHEVNPIGNEIEPIPTY